MSRSAKYVIASLGRRSAAAAYFVIFMTVILDAPDT